MKKTHLIALAMAAAVFPPLPATEDKPGALLRDIDMLAPGEGDPAFKRRANDQWGTQWAVDAAYGFWGANHALHGTHDKNNYALLHAQLNQRLAGDTWFRAELNGSWALDAATRHCDRRGFCFAGGAESGTEGHADMYGANGLYLPELALMQYLHGGRGCIIAGMVNLSNYFDTIGIANDSFSHFVNTGFVNSCILPLPCANLGAVLQYELSPTSYAQIAVSGTDTELGYNPFSPPGHGYCLVGEYGHLFAEGAATLRLTPFCQNVEADDGRHDRCGVAASIECTPWDALTVYARGGVATKQALGGTAEFSCGATVKPFSSREDDFLGLSWGVFKHLNADEYDMPAMHPREHVIELMYSFQLCEQVKIVPHFQYIHHPAYRSDASHASIFGVQGVISF